MSEERQPPDEEARDAVKGETSDYEKLRALAGWFEQAKVMVHLGGGERPERHLRRIAATLEKLLWKEFRDSCAQCGASRDMGQCDKCAVEMQTVEVATLRSALKTAQDEGAALKTALESKRNENEILQADCRDGGCLACAACCDDMEQRAKAAESACADLRTQRDSLKARLSEFEEAEASRQDEVATLKLEVQRLRESPRDSRAEAAERNLKLVADLAIALVGK